MEMYDTMRQLVNAVPVPNEPRETVKGILENMNSIIMETYNVLSKISMAIYNPPKDGVPAMSKDGPDESMLDTLNRLRNIAEDNLKLAVHISEVLW